MSLSTGPPERPYVDKKNNLVGCGGRAAVVGEDVVTGEIIAFVFGRRTNQTFRHLFYLLAEAKIEVIKWITDSWCGVARAGLF